MAENPAQERRRYERYPVCCPLEYKAEDERPKELSTTINVSEGGALISAMRDLAISSNVILKLKMRGELFFIISQVKHIRKDEDIDAYEIGVEFWDKPRTFAKKFYEELEGIKDYQKRYKEEQASEISLAEASISWYKNTSD